MEMSGSAWALRSRDCLVSAWGSSLQSVLDAKASDSSCQHFSLMSEDRQHNLENSQPQKSHCLDVGGAILSLFNLCFNEEICVSLEIHCVINNMKSSRCRDLAIHYLSTDPLLSNPQWMTLKPHLTLLCCNAIFRTGFCWGQWFKPLIHFPPLYQHYSYLPRSAFHVKTE